MFSAGCCFFLRDEICSRSVPNASRNGSNYKSATQQIPQEIEKVDHAMETFPPEIGMHADQKLHVKDHQLVLKC